MRENGHERSAPLQYIEMRPDATAFVLESTSSLTPPILWTPVVGTATDAGDVRSMTLSLPVGPRFYRLRKP